MSNLGAGIREETREETIFNNLIKLIKNGGYLLDKAMDVLEIPTSERSFYQKRYNEIYA
jgi:hypothetical protein